MKFMQDIEMELYFDNTEKWNSWLRDDFINNIRNIFETENIVLNDICSVRWQIFREYDVHFLPYKCTIKIVENYEPSCNIYNDEDFVMVTMRFRFSQLDGNIATIEPDKYNELCDSLNNMYKDELLPICKNMDA